MIWYRCPLCPDTYTSLKPLIISSSKDRFRKSELSLKEAAVSIFDDLKYEKKRFTGKGSTYEGKRILSDISKDLYGDGLPAIDKSDSGDIMVAWTKSFASSCLITRYML